MTPSDKLESDAYHDSNTIAACAKCGELINVEEDMYGESLDRETFVCYDCRKGFAMLGAIKTKTGDEPVRFFAVGSFMSEEVTTRKFFNESQALKRAAELAELAWGVESYIEKG